MFEGGGEIPRVLREGICMFNCDAISGRAPEGGSLVEGAMMDCFSAVMLMISIYDVRRGDSEAPSTQ